MNQFFLEFTPKKEQPIISYNSTIFLVGSCFVENIVEKLTYNKLRTIIYPFGIVFHPIALENLLSRIVEQRLYTEADIFYHNEQWHCFEVHSELSHPSKDAFIALLNTQLKTSYHQLQEA